MTMQPSPAIPPLQPRNPSTPTLKPHSLHLPYSSLYSHACPRFVLSGETVTDPDTLQAAQVAADAVRFAAR